MKKEDIEKAANQRSFIETPDARERFLFSSGFKAGANWRVNNSWHDPNIPLNNEDLILVEENSGVFSLCFEFSPENTKRWAYVKDLIPGKEE